MYQYDSKGKTQSAQTSSNNTPNPARVTSITPGSPIQMKSASAREQRGIRPPPMGKEQKPPDPSSAKPNNTGIPSKMRKNFEAMSGFSFDKVKVHYNSKKPAQLKSFAYTQGNQVYVGPGNEGHLGHELGHVVQQMQGRVRPTLQFSGMNVNDNAALEREADELGRKSAEYRPGMTGEYIKFLRTTQPAEVAKGKLGSVVQRDSYWKIINAQGSVASPVPIVNANALVADTTYWRKQKDGVQRMYNSNIEAKAAAATATGVNFARVSGGTGSAALLSYNDIDAAATEYGTKFQAENPVLPVMGFNLAARNDQAQAAADATADGINNTDETLSDAQYAAIQGIAAASQNEKSVAYRVSNRLLNANHASVHKTKDTSSVTADGEYYYFGAGITDSHMVKRNTPVIAKHISDPKAALDQVKKVGGVITPVANSEKTPVKHWHAGIVKPSQAVPDVGVDVGDWNNPIGQPKYRQAGNVEHYFIKPT